MASSDDHFWTLGANETSGESTWIGGSPSGQTDWDLPGNWEGGVPTTTSIVAIPSGRAYYPVLPTGKTIGALDIKDGGILNATTGSPTLTIAGTTNAWMNQGTFNGGTSTVVFTGNGAEIDGTTNFYNITINSGANIINHTNSVTRIGGVITKTGTWDASMADNFVEYNGESQTLVLPDFSPNYHNLILSGSGTKTMPASALSLYGEFIMMGTTSATAGGAMTIEGIHPNITIGTGCTFDASTFTHTLAGSWTNDGTFTASTSTIKFNGTAAENIGGTSASTFNNLDIDNTGSGLTLGIGQTINGTLSLTHGKLFLSDYNLTLNTDNAIAGTPNGSNYIEYTGTGKLVKNISAIMGTAYLFPVGTAGSYSPATFRLTGGTVSAASLSLSLANSKQTNITDANYINRYWTFTPTGFTSPVYNATFTYVDGDIIGTESTIKAYKYSGGWEKFSITNIGSNLLSFTGATAFSDYTGFGDLAVSVSSSVNPVCSGLPVTISASASGGNNGYSYTWDPSGSGASFSPSPDLTTTTAFYVTVTDGDGATQRASVNVIVDQRQSVMLNFNYNNLANTLLTSGITAELWQGGSQKATVSTPAVGHDYYEFTNTCPGTYDVMVSSATSTAGTINGTDAAQVNYWGTHTYTIEKVRFYAGDVAGNNKFLNSNDAQRINNNFVNGTALDRSGWTFWNASTTYSRNSNQNEVYADFPSLTLAVGSNKTENMYGVISGDFNLSYSPAKSLTGGNLELIYENNVLLAPNQEINLPIHIVNENKVGAISLVLNFPANLVDIQDVMISSTDGQLDWAVKNNELRIAWYSLNPLVLNAGDLLLNLRIKTTAAFSNGSPVQFSLAPNPSNELADELYNVINNAVISMASINATTIGIQEKPQVSDNLSLRNHPNPFVGTTTFTYDLPFDGKVSLEIYDFMGKRIRLVLNEQQLKGSHVLKLDASSLAAGIYMASLTLSSDNNKITRTIKLINNK